MDTTKMKLKMFYDEQLIGAYLCPKYSQETHLIFVSILCAHSYIDHHQVTLMMIDELPRT